MSLGFDYKVHPNKTQTGSYGLVGTGAKSIKTSTFYQNMYKGLVRNINLENGRGSTTETNIGYNVGIEYDLDKNLDIQLCYGIHKYDNKASSKITTAITCIF